MEVPHRTGMALTAVGVLMLLAGSLANVLLAPATLVGTVAGVRALRRWNGRDGSEAPLWAGVALVCALIPAVFALASGVLGWALWAWTTAGLLAVGWVAARQHAARLHRRWALERRFRVDPSGPHPDATPRSRGDR